ncbi:hypothetical protein KFL_000060680 [Klebsormidium nitens]|uniref:Ubiquitin-like protease family profile domain-containing protein n=1 Tax=Klebsormidium nitens TaxID=105231 RepID=A0A0U9HIW6_KLENI|nr:hypothetical protein KFL_000060680 [Klebsormidium nitens]|eukprot:GAQ78002.1 hypothetical protein KFL_000060680 [Klebsormidium nitens]
MPQCRQLRLLQADTEGFQETIALCPEKDPRNLSWLAVTDGVATFKKGNKTYWPLYAANLNLRPEDWFRKSNCVLLALIPNGKPANLQTYLEPLVSELKDYGPGTQGLVVPDPSQNDEPLHLHLLLQGHMSDYQGLPLFTQQLATGALQGCLCCTAPGEHSSILDKVVYNNDVRRSLPPDHPFRTDPSFGEPELREPHAKRTHNELLQLAQVVEQTPEGQAKQLLIKASGVKGVCALQELRYYDMVRRMVIDGMHALGNTSKRMAANIQGEHDTKKSRLQMQATAFQNRTDWIQKRLLEPGEKRPGKRRKGAEEAEEPQEIEVFPRAGWVMTGEEKVVFSERMEIKVPSNCGDRPSVLFRPGSWSCAASGATGTGESLSRRARPAPCGGGGEQGFRHPPGRELVVRGGWRHTGTLKKTHTWIFFGTVLFPYAVRNLLEEEPRLTLIRLSSVMLKLTTQDVRKETEAALLLETIEALCLFHRDLPESEQVITVHILQHLCEQRTEGAGPMSALDMFAPERWHNWLTGLRFSSKAPEASIAQRYSIEQTLALAESVLANLKLDPATSVPDDSLKKQSYRLHGQPRIVAVRNEELTAIDKLNQLESAEYAALQMEFSAASQAFKSARQSFRKHHTVAASPEYPNHLQSFPDNLLDWLTEKKGNDDISPELLSLVKGPSAFAEKFEHLSFPSCHFRSKRLDELSKATQDSGIKARLSIRRLQDGSLQRLQYFGHMLYVLRVRVGDTFRDYMRAAWYRKPQQDELHGLWTVKKDGLIGDKWRPFVRMQDVEGQVFYGDDPLERSVRIVLEKQPRAGRSFCTEAGDEGDLAAAAAEAGGTSSCLERREVEEGRGKCTDDAGSGSVAEPGGEDEGKRESKRRDMSLGEDNPQQQAEMQERSEESIEKEEGPEASASGFGSGDAPPTREEMGTGSESDGERAGPLAIPVHLLQALHLEKPCKSTLPFGLTECLNWINDEEADGNKLLAQRRAGGSRSGASLDVRREDLKRFAGNNLLNDVDMDAMTGLIAAEAERQGLDACFFSSLFYVKLSAEGVSRSLLRWISRQALQPRARNGFFVVNVNQNHWIAFHALPTAQRPALMVYDSSKSPAGPDPVIIQNIKQLHEAVLQVDPGDWEVTVKDCSQQGADSMDCGIYCLHFMRCLALGQQDMMRLSRRKGTEVLFDESIEYDLTKLDGGAPAPGVSPINPDNLPRDPKQGCKPVFPNELVRVNTIFEVAAQSGLYTAFADKHIGAYTIAKGPSGTGVSDYASLEVATTEPQYTDANGLADGLVGDNGVPIYDSLKVAQAINWIDGFDHTRTQFNGKAPAIMYYNYQVVSVNQKLAGQGYVNNLPPPAGPVPTEYVRQAIAYADSSIGQLIAELEKNQILGQTVLIVTAKHGQSPIDPSLLKKLKPSVVTDAIAGFLNDTSEPAQLSGDDSLLIWLHNTAKGPALRDYLNANKAKFLIDQWYHYSDLGLALNDYVPDIQCKSVKGTIYTGGSKIEEHGGYADDDTHVPIFVANKYLTANTDFSLIATKQIAPTTLTLLGLDYTKLQAVGIEGTQLLPNTELY